LVQFHNATHVAVIFDGSIAVIAGDTLVGLVTDGTTIISNAAAWRHP
jgi:hypothetical protein